MRVRHLLICCACLLARLMNAYGQPSSNQDFSIKVGVKEVRIDATVLDKNGHQITDLTANDFEVYQDGKPQKITLCVYVANSHKPKKTIASPEASKAGRLVSTPMLPREEVRRTIAFLFNGDSKAQMAIERFVESQMEDGDLVTIIGGATGIGALQKFSSDRRELLSRIKNLRIIPGGGDPCLEGSFGQLPAVDASLSYEKRQAMEERIKTPNLNMFTRLMFVDEYIQSLKRRIAAIRYGIRALQDMPGRKYLILMSSDIYYEPQMAPLVAERLMNDVANEALRAEVVVFTLDMKGLSTCIKTSPLEHYLPLSKKTGGVIAENSNFFLHGIQPVQEALQGYYLLSYVPPATTFEKNNKQAYHQIKIKVRRAGSEVHSRDGFFDPSYSSNFAVAVKEDTLQQAIFSPFLHNDLKLSVSSGYAHSPASGYFLRSWIHLDGKDLTYKEEKQGVHLLSLQLATLTADSNGTIRDAKGFDYDFRLNDADISRIRKDGIDLSTYLPVKSPGDYYVHAAIKDKATEKIGSGYQFVEIPDLSNRRLSLSSIFIIDREEDVFAIQSGKMVAGGDPSDSIRNWQALDRSPALRSYLPGESLDYAAVIYNGQSRKSQVPELELVENIFKDGKEYSKGNPEAIDPRATDDLGRIPITKRLTFDKEMPEGTYLLQLVVRDKQNNYRTASRAIDFEIHAPMEPSGRD